MPEFTADLLPIFLPPQMLVQQREGVTGMATSLDELPVSWGS